LIVNGLVEHEQLQVKALVFVGKMSVKAIKRKVTDSKRIPVRKTEQAMLVSTELRFENR